MTDRVDISSMTDAEKARMYEEHRQDMVDRQPGPGTSSTDGTTQTR